MKKAWIITLSILICIVIMTAIGCSRIDSSVSSEPEELVVTDDFEVITEDDQEVGGF